LGKISKIRLKEGNASKTHFNVQKKKITKRQLRRGIKRQCILASKIRNFALDYWKGKHVGQSVTEYRRGGKEKMEGGKLLFRQPGQPFLS